MGSEMSEVLPNLYVGSLSNSQDINQIKKYKITHIVSILENPKKFEQFKDKKYLHIQASDSPFQNLEKYFVQAIDFIHRARLNNGNVLIHCVSGFSRSVTIATAYIMTCSRLSVKDSLNLIKSVRIRADPSPYFLKQLVNYELTHLDNIKSILLTNYRQSCECDSKIWVENLIIDRDPCNVTKTALELEGEEENTSAEDDLVKEIFKFTSNVLENGIKV